MGRSKYQIHTSELPTAIAYERARANVLERWGHDVRDIRALADNYARRLMDLPSSAETQQSADIPEEWSAESTNLEVAE